MGVLKWHNFVALLKEGRWYQNSWESCDDRQAAFVSLVLTGGFSVVRKLS
jgi:hypothetical protein